MSRCCRSVHGRLAARLWYRSTALVVHQSIDTVTAARRLPVPHTCDHYSTPHIIRPALTSRVTSHHSRVGGSTVRENNPQFPPLMQNVLIVVFMNHRCSFLARNWSVLLHILLGDALQKNPQAPSFHSYKHITWFSAVSSHRDIGIIHPGIEVHLYESNRKLKCTLNCNIIKASLNNCAWLIKLFEICLYTSFTGGYFFPLSHIQS